MRILYRLVNLIVIVAGMMFMLYSSFTALGVTASSSAAPTTKNDDPLISKWPEYLAWYRSHGGMGKSY